MRIKESFIAKRRCLDCPIIMQSHSGIKSANSNKQAINLGSNLKNGEKRFESSGSCT